MTVAGVRARRGRVRRRSRLAQQRDDGARSRRNVLNDDHGDPALDLPRFPRARRDACGLARRRVDRRPRLRAKPSPRGEIWSSSSDDGGHTWRPNTRVATDVLVLPDRAAHGLARSRRGRVPWRPRGSLRDPRPRSRATAARRSRSTRSSRPTAGCARVPVHGPGAITLNRGGGGHVAVHRRRERRHVARRVRRAVALARRRVRRAAFARRQPARTVTPMLAAMGATTLAGVTRARSPTHAAAARRARAGARRRVDAVAVPRRERALGRDRGREPRTAYAVWQGRPKARSRLRVVQLTRR